jgi:signal peptidase II
MIQVLIIILGVAVDQISKYLLAVHMAVPGSYQNIIPGVFSLRYVENAGAAMGLFQDMHIIIIPLTILMMIGLGIFLIKNKNLHMLVKVTISMIISGGIGNLLDRVFMPNGIVRDFFEFDFVNFYVFNFADVLVTVGAVLLACYIIYTAFQDKKAASAVQQGESAEGENETAQPENGSAAQGCDGCDDCDGCAQADNQQEVSPNGREKPGE